MYKPADRIRHPLPDLGAPSAAEAAASSLFSPIRLSSGLLLAERSWVPAMVPWRAAEQGTVTEDVLDWYARFAEGQPGAIVVEATGVRDVPSGPLLRIGDDRFVAGLRRLCETVRERSDGRTRLFIQLIDFLRIRRRPEPGRFFREFLQLRPEHRRALSELTGEDFERAPDERVRERLAGLGEAGLCRVLDRGELTTLRFGERELVGDLHRPHIRELPRVLPGLFAAAAARAQDAGFDGVELHYAHAYTMASFLSPLNQRDDGYGASRENRVRLPLEVLAAVRAAVGRGFAVGCRMLCDEIIDGGGRVEDACFYGVQLARAGIDYVSLSTGGKFEDAAQPKIGQAAYPYTGQSGWECMPTALADALGPFGRNAARQGAVRAAIRAAGLATPVVVCGGICSFAQAEAYLRDGTADIIAAARQSLADPDWWRKLRLGRGSEIRRCVYSNYCEGLDQHHKKVTCKLWDRQGLNEPGVATTDGGKRRLTAPRWR